MEKKARSPFELAIVREKREIGREIEIERDGIGSKMKGGIRRYLDAIFC